MDKDNNDNSDGCNNGRIDYLELINTEMIYHATDRYVKGAMLDPDVRNSVLEMSLKPELFKKINLDTVKFKNTDFIRRSDLKELHADLLLEYECYDGTKINVYFLIEHKSYPDENWDIQVLKYKIVIWENHKINWPANVPYVRIPIKSILICHGGGDMYSRNRFSDSYGDIDPVVKEGLLDYETSILNFEKKEYDEISKYNFKYRLFSNILKNIDESLEIITELFSRILRESSQKEIDDNEDFIIFTATYVRGKKKGTVKEQEYENIKDVKVRKVFMSSLEMLLEEKKEEERRSIAKNMKNVGFEKDQISRLTGLTIEEVEKI